MIDLPFKNSDESISKLRVFHDITKYKHAKDELRESERRYRRLAENARDMIYRMSLPKGIYEYVSPASKDIFGYSPKEFYDSPILIRETMHPDWKDYFKKQWTLLLADNMPPFYEYQIINKSGETRWVNQRNVLIHDENGKPAAIEGVVTDITDRKQAEDTLRNERDNLKNIFEAMRDCVYIVNRQFDIQYANPAMEKEFGDYKGLKCYKYFHDRVKICPWCPNSKVFAGETVHWEWSSFKNGKTYALIDTPIKNSDGSISKLEIFHDITERKITEKELNRQLIENEIILKEVHHRIKNNFASIGSLLSLQAHSTTNPEVQSALQDTIGRINSMQVLYEKLLLSDNYHITSIEEYLDNLIYDIVNLFSENIDITIEKQIDDFQLDPDRLVPIGIIVNELLTNIMKYAFKEKDSGIIEVTVKEKQGKVSITIQDNGTGLPGGFDISESKGFGLMLVQMLSKQLDGSFTIESNNGTKSTLVFCI